MAKVTDNTNNVINELTQKASIFLRMMADEIVDISTPITPKKSGRLRMDVTKQVLGLKGKIIWGKHYGVYQERGYTSGPVKNYTTAGTKAHFAKSGAEGCIEKTSDVAKRSGLI